jgi:hypothetical protein
MRLRAVLVGALATACAQIAGPGSAATVGILDFVDADCCSISNSSKIQSDPIETAKTPLLADLQRSEGEPIAAPGDGPGESSDPITVNEVANDGSERAGDSLEPVAMALKDGGELDDSSPDAVSSVVAAEPSVLTRLLLVFADLRATVFGGP